MALEGRYLRLEPLGPAHADALFAANRVDDAIWDYLPYGPFANVEAYRDWVTEMAGKPDPLFFALVDRARDTRGGVASLLRITPTRARSRSATSASRPRCSGPAPPAR